MEQRKSYANWSLPIGANVTADGVRFRVWAPEAQSVEVVQFDKGSAAACHPLQRDADGYWTAEISGIGAGTRYAYSVNGDEPRPDPAARFQPEGVHAPSQVVDPAGFAWNDTEWRGVPLDNLIIYEAHVGTATPEGTFDALIAKLPYLRDLGVTALEIMPIHDFPGCRNWGYDGVDLYAPANCYGGPDGFKRLVNAAHAHGLAIILDVVYNHFGPDGNYLRVFSPAYFTEHHHTPWGDALNLDTPGSAAVRSFLINNALYWAHEYHIDGLRLDATHALIDESKQHFLQELTTTVRGSLAADRHFVLIAEDERNDTRVARPATSGGYGLDGQWADDFHHAARIFVTGERGGYYDDYSGSIAELITTITDGWLYQGQVSPSMGHERGTDPRALGYPQFVYCIQNHDQIGNRPVGDRLNHAIDPQRYRALSALLLLLPQTPLLFQGQEWAASTPFQYFTDHNPELGKLVTEGRRQEFAYFLTETGIEVPDPQAEATFANSKLKWAEIEQPPHAETLALYRDLISLRRTQSALRRTEREALHIDQIDERAFTIQRDGEQPGDTVLIVVNLGDQLEYALHTFGPASLLLDTNDTRYNGAPSTPTPSILHNSQLSMDAAGVVVLRRAA